MWLEWSAEARLCGVLGHDMEFVHDFRQYERHGRTAVVHMLVLSLHSKGFLPCGVLFPPSPNCYQAIGATFLPLCTESWKEVLENVHPLPSPSP